MSGAERIAAERRRQVEAEGWTPEHDDEHDGHEMVAAAVAYAEVVAYSTLHPHDWPWHESWWKPSDDPIRNLVKAGALIAAEIDRLERAVSAPRGAGEPDGKPGTEGEER